MSYNSCTSLIHPRFIGHGVMGHGTCVMGHVSWVMGHGSRGRDMGQGVGVTGHRL